MLQFRLLSLTTIRNVTNVTRQCRPSVSFQPHLEQTTVASALFATPNHVRSYNRKKTLKVLPTKPLNFDYGGDIQKTLKPINLADPKLDFEGIKELEEAESEVKKLFSLEFADGRAILKKQINDIVEKVKLHPADVQSLEYQLTLQTILIRNQIKHCLEFRKDKVAKTRLVRRIFSRKHNLRKMRELDFEKFEWLLEELQIKYVPYDPFAHRDFGKRALRKMAARNKTLAMYKQKLHTLQAELGEEKQKFDVIKVQELEKIEKQLSEIGIEPQETLEETINMLKYGTAKMKKEPLKSRRQQLLEKKFAMWADRKKKLEAENYEKALYNL